MKYTRKQLQDTFNETVEVTLAGHPNMDKDEAVEIPYAELKPQYTKHMISNYKYLVGLADALKRDPVNRRIKAVREKNMGCLAHQKLFLPHFHH